MCISWFLSCGKIYIIYKLCKIYKIWVMEIWYITTRMICLKVFDSRYFWKGWICWHVFVYCWCVLYYNLLFLMRIREACSYSRAMFALRWNVRILESCSQHCGGMFAFWRNVRTAERAFFTEHDRRRYIIFINIYIYIYMYIYEIYKICKIYKIYKI